MVYHGWHGPECGTPSMLAGARANEPPNDANPLQGSSVTSSAGTPDIETWNRLPPRPPRFPITLFQSPTIGGNPPAENHPRYPVRPPYQLGSPPPPPYMDELLRGLRPYPMLPSHIQPRPQTPVSPFARAPERSDILPRPPAPVTSPVPAPAPASPSDVPAAARPPHLQLDEIIRLRLSLLTAGTSPNYRGNPFLAANQSADIPDEQNTALWLTNLPPDCDHRMLLGAVRGCGKVYAAVVNPPAHAQNHITAACKLVFFDVAGAQALLRQAREGLFAVAGYVPRVRHNRIRTAARPLGPQSRVLHIEGPERVVDAARLAAFFAARFTFELERVVTLGRFGQRARQEWRFGSYRCQAESARASIAREKERLGAMMGAAGGGCAAAGDGGNDGDGVAGGQPQHIHQQQEDVDLEERLAWQSVTVHFAVDPCSEP